MTTDDPTVRLKESFARYNEACAEQARQRNRTRLVEDIQFCIFGLCCAGIAYAFVDLLVQAALLTVQR